MSKIVVIGAGKTGRGFIGRLLAEAGKEILFVDKNAELVDRLNREKAFRVSFFGGSRVPVTVNNYTAWYSKDGLTLPDWKVYLSELFAYMESTGNSHKPVVISEFGAGGIYNTRELEEGLYWTENYQQEYLEYTLNLFMNEERIQGALIWQFADIRSGTRSNDNGIRRLLARPRSFNNKGLLNEFRRPKMAYYAVKKLFTLK